MAFEKSSEPNVVVVDVEDDVFVKPEELDVFEPDSAFEPAVEFLSAFNFASSSARFLFVFDLVYNGINTPNDNNENTMLPSWQIVLNLLSLIVASSSDDFKEVCFAQFHNFCIGLAPSLASFSLLIK